MSVRRQVQLPCGTKITAISVVPEPLQYVRLRVEDGEDALPGTLTIDREDRCFCNDTRCSASKFFLNLRRDGLEQIIELLREMLVESEECAK